MGGRGSGATRNESQFTQEDWQEWSEDPSIFQRAERGDDISQEMYEYYEEDADEEFERISAMAKRMQYEAEHNTVRAATLYRGERFNSLQEAERKYSVGATIETGQLTSYSLDRAMANDYAHMYSGKVAVLIENTNNNGKFVGVQADHVGYAAGKDPEVIAPRGMKSRVVATRFDKSSNTLIVTMSNDTVKKKKH